MADAIDEYLQKHGVTSSGPTGAADPVGEYLKQHGVTPEGKTQAPGMIEGAGRAFLSGMTADFDDEALGLVSKDWQESSRAKKKAFAEESPWTSGIAKGVGAAAGMVLPAGWMVRTGRMAQSTMNAMNTMRGGAAVGVGYGALDRAGTAASGDGVGERLKEASGYNSGFVAPVMDAALGAGGAWIGNQVGRALGNGADEIARLNQVINEHGSTSSSASREVARTMQREGLTDMTPVRQQVWGEGNFGRTKMTPEGYQRAAIDYHDAIAAGVDHDEAIRRVAAAIRSDADRLRDHHGGVGTQRTIEGHVRQAVERFREQNGVPTQVNELAAMAAGQEPGRGAGFKHYQALNKLPGEDQTFSNVERFVTGRQRTQQQRMEDFFRREAGDPRSSREIAEEARNRIGASNGLYDPVIEAFNNDSTRREALSKALGDFDAEWNQALGVPTPMNRQLLPHARSFARDVTHVGDEIQSPVLKRPLKKVQLEDGSTIHVRQEPQPVLKQDGVTPETKWTRAGDVTERQGYDDLAHAIDARASLNAEISRAKRADPGMVPRLMEMKASLDARLRAIAPEWAEVNDTRAGAGALQRAFEHGRSLNLNASGNALDTVDQMIAQYRGANPERQQMFRKGLSTQLEDLVMRQGRSHDVAKLFDRPQTIRLLREAVGDDFVDHLEAVTRRAAHATATHGATKGSQTADVASYAENMRALSRLVGGAGRTLYDPIGSLGRGLEWLAVGRDRSRNDAMLKLLSANTDDLRQLMRSIDEIERAMQVTRPAPDTAVGDHIRHLSPFIAAGQATQAGEWR